MSVPWKSHGIDWRSIANRVRISNWTPMVWATLIMVTICTTGTVLVGMQLYAITGHQVQFSTK